MSMTILIILQICAAFLAYMVVTCVLPMVLIHRKYSNLRPAEQFMLSVVLGNFFIINEVFLLEFLHIACRFTLILGALLPFTAAAIHIYEISVRKTAVSFLDTATGILEGEIGIKTQLHRFVVYVMKLFIRGMRNFGNYAKKNPFDVIFFSAISALTLYIHLPNLLTNYGYKVSDLPVHNYWIDSLEKGKLFVAGVYPYGFHCVIYYLHAVFGMKTYVLLRVFAMTETMLVVWMLLFFLRACLRSAFLPHIAVMIYAAGDLFVLNTYYRFGSSLPQEFGMIFLLPAVYFGFSYFKARERWCLFGFAASFALTISTHFYGTMIVGIFCVAMAIGFAFRFFRKQYFLPIAAACAIGVAVAATPMAFAYALGTPLQGALGWGLSVVNGTDSDEETETETGEITEIETETEIEETVSAGAEGADEIDTGGKFIAGIKSFCSVAEYQLNEHVFSTDSPYPAKSVFVCIAICLIFSVLYLPFGEKERTGQLLSVGIFMIFLCLLFCAKQYHLPKLMDDNRIGIYFAYMLPVLFGFAADAVLVLPGRLLQKPVIYRTASLLLSFALCILFAAKGMIRSPYLMPAMETNDAIICLANIISEREDMTWTICSANDELRMAEDYGAHEELIEFLWKIDDIGRFAGVNISTEYTYFFVEKTVIDYADTNEKTDMTVSEEYAKKELPGVWELTQYEKENRAIVMSRIYYWCEAFMQMYPENMKVYYETDDFVCYVLRQNTDQLFELGIDYGYNRFYQ